MKTIRLLIVDDSAFMRKVITDFFSGHPLIQVIGTARNGADAVEKVRALKPDAVTMDLEMPVMDGVQAVREIMASSPVPVVMLSSMTREGADQTILAMEAGAADFVAKPGGSISMNLELIKDELTEKLIHAAGVDVQKRPALPVSRVMPKPAKPAPAGQHLVLIGTSTGGPRALQEVMGRLPANLPAPVCIVQHMPPKFTKSLADRLNLQSPLTVKEAEAGEVLRDGYVYIAPGGMQMRIEQADRRLVISLSDEQAAPGTHRPSVNVLFESAAKLEKLRKTAVIMTGMGTDGTKGLAALKRRGLSHVIAEAEETCIIYGMPKAAKESGLTDEMVPLQQIAESIVNSLR